MTIKVSASFRRCWVGLDIGFSFSIMTGHGAEKLQREGIRLIWDTMVPGFHCSLVILHSSSRIPRDTNGNGLW